MASADCECCGQPTTAPDGNGLVPIERECTHGCYDCPSCHACDYGDCSGMEYVLAVVLCDGCSEDGDCGPGAWHCRCGRACDGSACPGDVRGADDGGAQ